MVSVKNLDKLMIVRNMLTAKPYWVGCNDIEEEDNFVWDEEGSPIPAETMNQISPMIITKVKTAVVLGASIVVYR